MKSKQLKFAALIFAGGAVFFGIFYLFSIEKEDRFIQTPSAQGVPAAFIMIDAGGFSPTTTKIEVGDIIMFKNMSGEPRWPASDLHPTHELYPAFDPGEPIPDGESWGFQFEEQGTWRFHDHLKPNRRGTIVVE